MKSDNSAELLKYLYKWLHATEVIVGDTIRKC